MNKTPQSFNSTLKMGSCELKRRPLKKVSKAQAQKQENWNRLVAFLSLFVNNKSECCGYFSLLFDGAHIIPKTRKGCTWTAKNCLLAPSHLSHFGVCGCHDHGKYADGLRMGIVAALKIARRRNEKYGINPEYTGAKEMNPYLEAPKLSNNDEQVVEHEKQKEGL